MPESLLAPPPVRAAFERIIDYAGLFPPATLPMAAAASEYERGRRSRYAWMLGRFVVPAAQIGALETALSGGEPVPLAVLAAGEFETRTNARVRAETCEIALRAASREIGAVRTEIRAIRKGMERMAPGLSVVVELPRGLGSALLAEAMDALRDAGFAAKIRCGGVTADATPSTEEVADFIRAACHARVPFKATAGLHHPLHHFNADAGFVMHGFLNVLAAACAAPSCDTATVRAIVAEEDVANVRLGAHGLAWRETMLADATKLQTVRRTSFLAFGSCSFAEPVDDLVALGIIAAQ